MIPNPIPAHAGINQFSSLASSFATLWIMLRFEVGSSSGRVGVRYTALRKASLGGRHFCSSTAMDMRGSLGCLLRALSALVPAWSIRNTSTAAALLWQREFFYCAGFASCQPARWILFVPPLSSSLAPWGSARVLVVQPMCWSNLTCRFSTTIPAMSLISHSFVVSASPSTLTPWPIRSNNVSIVWLALQPIQTCSRTTRFGDRTIRPCSRTTRFGDRTIRPCSRILRKMNTKKYHAKSGLWIPSSNLNRKRFDHLPVFAPISALIHRVQPLLTG